MKISRELFRAEINVLDRKTQCYEVILPYLIIRTFDDHFIFDFDYGQNANHLFDVFLLVFRE